MIDDARRRPPGTTIDCDVCVVGTGAAGVTVALGLAGSHRRILVLEAGGVDPDPLVSSANLVESVDLPIGERSRQRFLGGTTNSWWGKLATLDGIDLRPRPWVTMSGWPLDESDLVGFYRRASRLLSFPDLTRFELGFLDRGRGLVFHGEPLESAAFFWRRRPLNFGHLLRRKARGTSNVSILLHANVTELLPAENGESVEAVRVATGKGRVFQVRPRDLVLTCGAIENARLLLNSNARYGGLGNRFDQVGRYFMDHPRGPCGSVVLSAGAPRLPHPAYWSGKRWSPARVRLGVRLSGAEQERERVLNSYVLLDPAYPDQRGVEALREIYRRRLASLRDPRLLGRVARSIPGVLNYLSFKHRSRGTVRLLSIDNFMEQEPRPENRVTLSDRCDAFGTPLPQVSWTLSEQDRKSVRTLHTALDREFRRLSIGWVESPLLKEQVGDWPIVKDAAHHMGTTRMGHDPRTSVVDANCRVHGVRNLHIAGSSVFATGGYANPTLTIVALALRLADRLRSGG